ncbi:hypothetical protein STEG23_006020 [Scotinomys teguina]
MRNRSSRQKSTKMRSLQPTLPGRPRGCPARKCRSRSRADEQTRTTEENRSTVLYLTDKSPIEVEKDCTTIHWPLAKLYIIEKSDLSAGKCPATENSSSPRRHHSERHLSRKRRHGSEKSRSSEKRLPAKKDLLTKRGPFVKKICPKEKGNTAKEGTLTERGRYGERGRTIQRGQPARRGLSSKRGPPTEKGYLDGRGPSTENLHHKKKTPSNEKHSSAERDRHRSVKRRLAKEKDLPAGRSHPTKSCPVEEAHSVEEDNSVERGASSGQDHRLGRL